MTESASSPDLPAGQPDWEAIARHLAGESSAEESAAVGAGLSARPADARAIAALVSVSSRLAAPVVGDADVEAALYRVHDRMRASETPVLPLRDVRRSTRRPVVPWTIAAAAVVVIAAGLVLSRRNDPAHPTAAARVIATRTGQLDSTRLVDGTRVIVGPSSELTIAAGYATGLREVTLRGSAFFEVRHDAGHPFTVRAGSAVITDIGTTFTVRGDSMEGVEVSVAEGSVRLQGGPAADVVLAAGDAAAWQGAGSLAVRRHGASADDAAWTKGRLIFRETSLARVRTDLRRWFGLELVIADSTLAGRHLTASFMNDSRRQVLDVIALALGASYELRGDTVTLRPVSPPAIRQHK